MHIPSPRELNFPPKFTGWRPSQAEALRRMLASQRRVKALSAPTGFGKTAVYIAYAIITQAPTCFVTESRGLQDQLMDDFAGVGLVDIRGRRNYLCDLKPDYTCEDGYAARCPRKGTIQCPASQAEMRAAISPLVVTNYDKWMAAKKFGQGMQHFQQVVLDEGHESPFALARNLQVILHRYEIEEVLGVEWPAGPEDMVNWKPWAVMARELAEQEVAANKPGPSSRPSEVRHYLHMRQLSKRLATIATAKPENWIVDGVDESDKRGGYQFDPVRVGYYAESTLLLHVPSIVVISATLRPKTLAMIGVKKETYDYWEFPSEFPPDRCPIYYIPTMRVDSRADDLGPLWTKLDQIAARRQDRKGIVHTISYARRDEILQRSRFAAQMIINPKGEASTETVMEFKGSGPGTILVSPSVGAGYDFPYDDCRWQLVCKIPFPQSTKIIKARQTDDPEYGYYIAMNKLVQILGRGMRAKDDMCENFIVDMHLEWFLPRYRHLAPTWFGAMFKPVPNVPPPLSL